MTLASKPAKRIGPPSYRQEGIMSSVDRAMITLTQVLGSVLPGDKVLNDIIAQMQALAMQAKHRILESE